MLKKYYFIIFFLFISTHTIIAQFARVDYDTADINTTLTVAAPGVLGNDIDVDATTVVTQFFVNGGVFAAGETANFGQGSITIAADGSYTFIPRTGYTGNVSTITYTISNDTVTSSANLFFTVEFVDNLLEMRSLGSCNQGFNSNGEYKIVYSLSLSNRSTARDTHENSLIRNIDLVNNLQAAFGDGCVVNVDQIGIGSFRNPNIFDYVNNTPYPSDFNTSAINPNFANVTSNSIFSTNAIDNFILYPGQSLRISYCVTVNPFCDGRPDPTPSGSGIDFTNTVSVTSSKGDSTDSVTLTDFHTTEAVVSAGLYVPEFNNQTENPPGSINADGTYDYTNTVIITNEGTAAAQNINYNMGLGDFTRNRITFNEIIVSQDSGPTVTTNDNYDGNDQTTLLMPNNSLAPGETIVLKVSYEIGPVDSESYSYFFQPSTSQTQSAVDGFDAFSVNNRRTYSFVTWSDSLGAHLDRYYLINSATTNVSSALYCNCTESGMRFLFTAFSSTNNVISNVDSAPNDILEHEEITFQITIENTSDAVQLDNLQLTNNLNNTCNGKVLSVTTPTILNSTATTNPELNPNYNGTSNTNLFNGSSGILKIDERITVEFTVLFNETCVGSNTAFFSARDPLNRLVTSSSSVSISASSDTDNDGITDDIDLDDDNDTIPDITEYNGVDPLGDDDSDFTPNYKDTDFGVDANGDGIVDIFDFDNDGVPNHFDLDSDNDGVLDIVEAGNIANDSSRNGRTNIAVGANGLDNTKETSDSRFASINYIIPNTDGNGNPNFTDIDADGDGIVDNIEAQLSNNYSPISTTVSSLGINTAYPNGINPVDTENDGTPDYIDTNSDNDIRDDIIEAWDDAINDGTQKITPLNSDLDNDGLDDIFDNDDTQLNPTNGQTPQSFSNFDNADTPELDWREIMAIVVLINNVTAEEGQDFEFELQLVRKKDNTELIESAFPIEINFSTNNGTDTTGQYDAAISPFDYSGFTGTTLTIPSFTNTATNRVTFTVTSLEDIIYELVEFFTLNGTITSNNTINTSISGIGTVTDNDLPPGISMDDSREDEGVDLVHTIQLTHPCSTPIIIDVVTNDNLALSPEDYTSISENLTIEGTIDQNNANINVRFSISSFLDNLNELDEEPLYVIGNVTTTNVGVQDLAKTAVIVDIDPNPLVEISNEETEEGIFLDFTISLLNADAELMQNYLPINLTLETIDDTATNLDYESILKQVTIPAYTSTISKTVNTIEDKLNEETETFFLQANIFSFTVSNVFPPRGTATIKDNDYPNLFSPNGDNKSDVFKISGIEDFPNFKLIIFNRLGNEVYNYSNNGNVNPLWWNGTHNGNPAPTGVYYYTLDFNDGVKKPITSFIQLIR